VEPRFFAALVELLELSESEVADRTSRAGWERLNKVFADVFATRTRDEWCDHPLAAQACVSPVLGSAELLADPHIRARALLREQDGELRTASAPRFL
jgi:alpha-methylacyl-CoA racemase